MLPQNALSPKQKTIKQQLSTNMVLALMPLWNICVVVALLFRPAPCPVVYCRPRSLLVQLTPLLPVPHTTNPAGYVSILAYSSQTRDTSYRGRA